MSRRRTRGDYDLKKEKDMLDNPVTIEKFKKMMDERYDEDVDLRGKSAANPWTKPFLYVVTGHPAVGDPGELQNEAEVTVRTARMFRRALLEGEVGWKIGVAHGKSAQKTDRLKSYVMHWGKSKAKIGWFQIQPNSHYADKKSVLLRKEHLLKEEMRAVTAERGKWQGREWFIGTPAEMRGAIARMQQRFTEGDSRVGFNGQGNRFSPRIRMQEEIMFRFAKELLTQSAQVKCNLPPVSEREGKGAKAYERQYCKVVFDPVSDEAAREYIRERRGQERM